MNDSNKEEEGPTAGATVVASVDLNEQRSRLDDKLYRHITLSNGVQAILIQDVVAMIQQQQEGGGLDDDDDESSRDASKNDNGDSSSEDEDCVESSIRSAACAVLVGAGSLNEPSDHPGLAHFLEHLLFMGSKKYPTENGYELHITKVGGGSDNACTEWNSTTYNFDVPNQRALRGALDRLAHFFVHPLLLESAVDRELKAIESEFQLNKNIDSVRREQLLLALESHPTTENNGHAPTETEFGHFAWGNLQSLSESYPALRPWFETNYCPSRIRVVLQAAHTLDELQDMVVSSCGVIPRRSSPEPSPHGRQPPSLVSASSTSITNVLLRIVPIKERHKVSISWKIPTQVANWEKKSADILSHLLGHEASGSVYSYLQRHSMATGCVAGPEDADNPTVFSVAFDLTDIQHWSVAVEAVMAYIQLLLKSGIPEYIFTELQQIASLSYQYGDELSPEDTVEMLAENMAPSKEISVDHLLSGSSLYIKYDEAQVRTLLCEVLTVERCRVDLISSTFGSASKYDENHTVRDTILINGPSGNLGDKPVCPPQKEPWFGTYFWCDRLPPNILDHWRSADPTSFGMHLPLPNPFVPGALKLKDVPIEDGNHPLLHAALKICLPVGKQKQWFCVNVVRYNGKKNEILVCFSDTDGDEDTWYTLDDSVDQLQSNSVTSGFLNQRQVPFRIVSRCPRGVQMAVHQTSDEFPPIPPSSRRLPQQIVNTSMLKLYWLQDRTFQRPLVELHIEVISKHVNDSALHRAVADMIVERAYDLLTEVCYLAELCELGSSVKATSTGFYLRFHGFDDQLLRLVEPVLSCLLGFRKNCCDAMEAMFDEERYSASKNKLERRYQNTGMDGSDLADNIRLQAIRTRVFSANEKLRAIKDMTIEEFQSIAAEILSEFALEAFMHGNSARNDVLETRDLILRLLRDTGKGLPTKKYPPQSVNRLPLSKEPSVLVVPSKNPEEPNTTCDVYFQVSKDNLHDRVVMDFLLDIMEEPMYDQLRTKEQFGYDVSCDTRWSFGIIGCIFHVTTNVKSAASTMERIESFLKDFRTTLVEMNVEDFEDHRIGLANQKLEVFSSLGEESSCYWTEIRDGRFEWEAARSEALYIKNITKEDLVESFDTWLLPGTARRMAVFQVIGTGGDVSEGRPSFDVPVDDFVDMRVEQFRRACKTQTWGRVTSKLF